MFLSDSRPPLGASRAWLNLATVGANPAGESSRDFIAETPQDGPQITSDYDEEILPVGGETNPLIDQEIIDDQLMDDVSDRQPSPTPDASVAGDEDPDDIEQARVDAEIARRLKAHRLASTKLELERLRAEDERGIMPSEDISSDSFKQRLALERAKSVHEPDVY